MTAHARRARPGVPMVGEDLTCGCRSVATVFLTDSSRAGRHRKCQARQQTRHAGSTNAGTRDGTGPSATASSQTPRAADPSTDHGRLCLIHCGNAPVVGNWECDCVKLPRPARRPVCEGILAAFVRTALALLTRYFSSIQPKQDNKLLCDEYFLRFPWTSNSRGVRGSPFFNCYFPFVLLCALHFLVCVRTLREGCRHDGPLSPYVHAVEPCVPLLFASPSSICVLVLRQGCVCVCLLPWIGVCVVRGVRRTVHAWLLPSPHVVCPLCVCLPHLSSPLLLSMSLTVQISSTPLNDHTHDDDDVPVAVRPVGARTVLLPLRLRDGE
ncbi:hypothetical protein ECC02_011966 [Trypanosoma cruzi]|uniref:Mucin TcMUCII n=1 Tax=Trypanosoma cruzi TaxID=5693 RepID=A0A7J6XMD2_TRYCR|nr:hypothetical protein ECC02_011966 [Trypanosoma cruzi]